MSVSTSSTNGTTIVTGPNVIQKSDFYDHAGVLHPLIIGSIAVISIFFYLRLGSNRSVTPISIFDWIINVAIGSTLAGIVNGNSLVRGLLALLTMQGFQYLTSYLSSNYKQRLEWIFHAPPLVLAFRGALLDDVMSKHRISKSDIYGALRQQGFLNAEEVETIIIEANGSFSIFSTKAVEEAGKEPAALMMVPAYAALYNEMEKNSIGGNGNPALHNKAVHPAPGAEVKQSPHMSTIHGDTPASARYNLKSLQSV